MPDFRTFINPYTFVPINQAEPDRREKVTGDKTGHIECTLTVKSPAFIPNTSKAFKPTYVAGQKPHLDHKSYVFYSYDDLSGKKDNEKENPKDPVIPGSSIRGMIRNIYEQLTNSCSLHVDEDNLPYKRTIETKEPAVLIFENSEWHLYYDNVDYHKVPKEELIKEKCDASDCVDVIEKNKIRKNLNGDYIVHRTESFYNSKLRRENAQIVFRKVQTGNYVVVSEGDIERLCNVVDSYCNLKPSSVYSRYKKRLSDKSPVFAYTDPTFKYLSPACITKEFFENTIEDILKKQHNHSKCTDITDACPACRLFGMVGDTGAIAGKIRITDTYWHTDNPKYEDAVLPILGSPRISATEFYLSEPLDENGKAVKKSMWNYDYYTTYTTVSKRLSYGKTKEETQYNRMWYDAKLRGRKVYWHGKYRYNSNNEATQMNCSVSYLCPDNQFKFKVYFDRLDDEELTNLLFCLKLNDTGIHKIGKGKPIGMGDVKITIDNLELRNYVYKNQCISVETKSSNKGDTECINCLDANLDAEYNVNKEYIMTYSNMLSEDESRLVQYPSLEARNSKVFEWFRENRGSIREPMIKHPLPCINEINKTLPKDPNIVTNR